MTDDRKSAIALIAASIGGMLTMAIHPVADSFPLTPETVARLAVTSAIAHSLAIVSFVALFLGACGLSRRLAAPDRLAFAAVVVFAFGCVAILIATSVSGFIVPDIMRHMVRDVPANAQQWKIAIISIFEINQAFARIYSVAASFAIILWSASSLRSGDGQKSLGRGLAIYGCIVCPLIIIGIASGLLHLDVHGMGLVVLVQAIWFILAGKRLYNSTDTRSESQPLRASA
jgi:heme A synthase